MTQSQMTAGQFEAFLSGRDKKTLLRFITCGSVDDGKSTLIGRLLYDSKLLPDDQVAALKKDSERFGTVGRGEVDLALLVDGLADERAQGITIDVAYRFFTTAKRRFTVADTPGHEQYTRNMATGASTADIAVLLVDARKGLLTQTRRHSFIVSLMGIRHIVLAVNKMDAVDWDRIVFDRIREEYESFSAKLDIDHVYSIPISALKGDNVTHRSVAMPWHNGPPLLAYLETVDVTQRAAEGPFRMPVQWVNRPTQDFRGYAGTIVGGSLAPGDTVAVLPAGTIAKVRNILTFDGELTRAVAGQAVTVTLDREVDVSRGCILADAAARPDVAEQFAAHIIWMESQAMLPGRSYQMQIGATVVGAQITDLKYAVNVNTLEHVAASHLDLNEIGFCNIALDRAVPFDSYGQNRDMGGFILVDRITNATVGCGMISFPLRRASNIHWQALKIGKAERSALKRQKPCVLWFTGLSGAGKSTIADLVEQGLHASGHHTMLLDGDNVRHGLNKDLGFTDEDRVENIRRVGEVAKLMLEAGLIVLVSFISPFRLERRMARDLVGQGEFFEIFVDAPLEVCQSRDPKGLYRKALAGEIPNFTGISSAYEPPEEPELHLESSTQSPADAAQLVLDMLRTRGIILT